MKHISAQSVYLLYSGASALITATMFTVAMVYFYTTVGLNPLQLVLVGTVLEGIVLLFEVPTGIVADLYSRRLSVILGTLILGGGFILIGVLPNFGAILIGQVITGIGYTFLSGALEAWLAGEVGDLEVGRVMLLGGQVERAGAIVGAVLSIALASRQLNLPLVAGGAAYLALGIFLILAMPEHGFRPRLHPDRSRAQAFVGTFQAGLAVVRGHPLLLALLAAGAVAGAASEGLDRLGDAHLLADFHLPALGSLPTITWFGILAIARAFGGLVVTEMLRPRLERASQQPRATAGALLALQGLASLSVLLFALAGSFLLAAAGLLARSALGALTYPLYTSWLVQNTDPQVRATLFSMFGQSDALGQVAGGPVIGWVGTVFSIRRALALSGLLLLPSAGIYGWVWVWKKPISWNELQVKEEIVYE